MINTCFQGSNSKYRSDIDGLRALACLAVVFYHAFPESIKGGFTGVDIFFVISGFLISSILYRNLYNTDNPGHVNIVDFYIRRVRRIFPALIAVLVFLLAVGWVVLLPDEYQRLGKHVLGGSTYISNFMLYFESGDYFNVESNLKPLLHLWSLGVEEQFYLIFPIFLWVLYKLRINFLVSLVVFTVISFAVNYYFVKIGNGTYSFYMPWTRFWELSFGSVLAYITMFKSNLTSKLQSTKIANILSILGVVLIVIGYISIPSSPKFPGSRALTPVLGALLVIAAGHEAFINKKILSSKLFIFFGLISYPLYLWHWPLLSLAYICNGQIPDAYIRAICVVLAIFLSILTFYFIEPPLRYGKAPKLKAISLFVVLLGLGGGLGYNLYINDGYSSRYPEIALLDKENQKVWKVEGDDYQKCKSVFPNWVKKGNDILCEFQDPKKNDVALIGDSHAGELYYALSLNPSFKLASFPSSWQPPLYDVALDHEFMRNCYQNIKQAYEYIVSDPYIKVVILAHWRSGLEYDVQNPKLSNYEAILNGAKRTFKMLKDANKKVIVLIDHPMLPYNPILVKRHLIGDYISSVYKFKREYMDNDEPRIVYNSAMIEASKEFDNVHFIDLRNLFCDDKYCYSNLGKQANGAPLFRTDASHLNVNGALYVAKEIAPKILELLK